MIKVSRKEAEEHLGELIEEAAAGQEVVITSEGGPAVRLVPESLEAVEIREEVDVQKGQRETWLEENRAAIEAYNEHVAQHGVFSAGLRGF